MGKVVPVSWEIKSVWRTIQEHGYSFARMPTPRGSVTKLKALGPLRGYCFQRCLQVASAIPDKMWYCEGYADGHPHAWLSPKILKGQPADENWAIDPTWMWKPRLGYPFDKIDYTGIRLEGDKVVKWILDKKERTGYASCSIFRSIGEWSIEELT